MARTVVITGAASGIGKATAALAETHGWQPIRVDLNEGDVKADSTGTREFASCGRTFLVRFDYAG